MLRVVSLPKYENEKKYVLDVIFNDFLGIKYNIEFKSGVNSTFVYGEKGSIEIPDIFFSVNESEWLTTSNLPCLPLQVMNGNFEGSEINNLPVIFGCKNDNGLFIQWGAGKVYFGIDILGASFFMLSRYEEYVLCQDRDSHDRFPVESALAYKAGFLGRPVINEYVDLLWHFLKKIDPLLKRKEYKYKVIPTHDIDKPFGMMFDSFLQIGRHFVGDILYRKSVNSVLKRARELFTCYVFKNQYLKEKSETFAFINNESKKHNLKDVFFFMNSKKSWYDGNYTIDDCNVLDVISQLVLKGHYVGLHPSFDSYMDGDEIKKEVASMNEVFTKNDLPSLVGARQHYLKWKNPDTWQYYEDAGIPFDSTMTYAGHVGFRCGVCYPFSVFNLETREQLKLVEYPLIVMDGTLYEYMGLSHEEALPVIKKLADECKKHKGDFVILWHNTTLDNKIEREFYSKMLDEVCCE